MTANKSVLISNDRLYDRLKYFVQIVLPALATLYFALSQIWGLPGGEEVVGTMAAVTTFLGVILGISNKQYKASGAEYNGSIDIQDDGEKKLYTLNYDEDPYELESKDEVKFKVNKPTDPGSQ